MQRTYSTEGVVLSRKISGEADRFLTIFSKHLGKVRVLAKGVRKPTSRKRGHIEIFTNLKFSATKLSGVDIVTEAEIINNYSDIRVNLKKVALSYYFVEVIGKITKEGEKNSELYDLLKSFLERLSTENGFRKMREDFIKETLVLLGYWPEGQKVNNIDKLLEEVIERKINTLRVGKQMIQ